MPTHKYVCRYLTSPGRPARLTYQASTIEEAIAMHEAAAPEYALSVIDWVGPKGLIHKTTIPPQLVTQYILGSEPGDPVQTDTMTDLSPLRVPPGHEIEWRHFIARDGSELEVTWYTLDGALKEIRVNVDLLGLHHWDTVGHNPFTCDNCPGLVDWSMAP